MATVPNEDFTKTRDDADAFFNPNNRVESAEWMKYDQAERDAAFLQAKTQLRLYLGRDLYDPGDETELPRDDYAVYVQALHLLREREGKSYSGDTVRRTRYSGKRLKPEGKKAEICVEAQRWLGLNRVKWERG